ncbi:TPA: hypothetical protein VDU98_006362 [Pseudomonas aeruginosa]|nr:hypothetical protein [Pseudomonas aeruginosa]
MDYDTSGFPLGSKDPRVLYKNAKKFDYAMNDRESVSWVDRFGVSRKTWFGVEQQVNDYLASQGFEPGVLEYVDGSPLTVDRPTQLIQRDGNLYSVKRPASFPVELTGNWATDQDLLVTQVDRSLRQQLADPLDPTAGAALVARASRHLSDLTGLIGLIGRYAGDMVQTAAYWGGWSVYADGPVGGGTYVWDPARPRSEHNAGNVISPTVPWDGLESTFAAYIAKTGETEPSALGCWVLVPEHGREFNALQWGAKNNATVNGANDAMIQPLLDYVEGARLGGFGGVVNFPRGTYRFSSYFNVRDRTTLRGEGTSATILQFPGSAVGHCITLGPTGPNHPTRGPGNYVFAARLEKMAISGGNVYKGLDRALVYTDGAHEHSGVFECTLRDFTSIGIHYNTGNGGPAFFEISDVEIYASTTIPPNGIRRGIYSSAGGGLILLSHATITGAEVEGGKLSNGVVMVKDNLVAFGVHIEECAVGISMSQTTASEPRTNTLSGITGNSTVADLAEVSSMFEGSVMITGISNTSLSTTGLNVIRNRRTGELIQDRSVSFYSYSTKGGEQASAARGRINVSGGVATIAKQVGRPFSASRTSVGVVRITMNQKLPDAEYIVESTARASQGMFVEFVPLSDTQFEIRTQNTSGVAADPTTIGFVLYT